MTTAKHVNRHTATAEEKLSDQLKAIRERLLMATGAMSVFISLSLSDGVIYFSDFMFLFYFAFLLLTFGQGAILLLSKYWQQVPGIVRRPFVSWSFAVTLLTITSALATSSIETALLPLFLFGLGILLLHFSMGLPKFNEVADDFFV